MHLPISVNFDSLFANSPCMVCKTLSVPKNSCISRSGFCDASRLFTWTSFAKDESSISSILSISLSVGNSCPFLVTALKDLSNAD